MPLELIYEIADVSIKSVLIAGILTLVAGGISLAIITALKR